MSLQFRSSWLVAWVLVLLPASAALAGEDYIPAPDGSLDDFQWFAPAEPSPYGGEQAPNEGLFVSLDALRWSISAPERTFLGLANPDGSSAFRRVYIDPVNSFLQFNTADTRFLEAEFTDGGRIEFGYVCDQHGWFISTFNLAEQHQREYLTDIHMVLDDPTQLVNPGQDVGPVPAPQPDGFLWGIIAVNLDLTLDFAPLPVVFDYVEVKNEVDTWSVEAMYMYRTEPTHHWGYWEVFGGPRYMQFDERFIVSADNQDLLIDDDTPLIAPPLQGILSDLWFYNETENHLVGPQIGARWFNKKGRWTWSAEGRFFAAFNYQNVDQQGNMATDMAATGSFLTNDDPNYWGPLGPGAALLGQLYAIGPTGFHNSAHFNEFSPTVELRVNASLQLTRGLSLKAGWTGTYIGNVARASNMVYYNVPNMGILGENNQQDVFIHGPNFGLELYR